MTTGQYGVPPNPYGRAVPPAFRSRHPDRCRVR